MATEFIPVWRLREMIGEKGVEDLIDAFGGTRIYVAAKQREGGRLARAIGLSSAKTLAGHLAIKGGINVAIPAGPNTERLKKQHKIQSLIDEGRLSIAQIARECGCTERTVCNHKAKLKIASGQIPVP